MTEKYIHSEATITGDKLVLEKIRKTGRTRRDVTTITSKKDNDLTTKMIVNTKDEIVFKF